MPHWRGGVLEKPLLQGMERVVLGHALDGFDLPSRHLAAQDETGADEAARPS
jgi:hypothetical protein